MTAWMRAHTSVRSAVRRSSSSCVNCTISCADASSFWSRWFSPRSRSRAATANSTCCWRRAKASSGSAGRPEVMPAVSPLEAWSDLSLIAFASGQRLLGDRHDLAEHRRLVDGQLGEAVSIQLNARLVQRADESAVGQAIRAASRIEALDPQGPEFALL